MKNLLRSFLLSLLLLAAGMFTLAVKGGSLRTAFFVQQGGSSNKYDF